MLENQSECWHAFAFLGLHAKSTALCTASQISAHAACFLRILASSPIVRWLFSGVQGKPPAKRSEQGFCPAHRGRHQYPAPLSGAVRLRMQPCLIPLKREFHPPFAGLVPDRHRLRRTGSSRRKCRQSAPGTSALSTLQSTSTTASARSCSARVRCP